MSMTVAMDQTFQAMFRSNAGETLTVIAKELGVPTHYKSPKPQFKKVFPPKTLCTFGRFLSNSVFRLSGPDPDRQVRISKT